MLGTGIVRGLVVTFKHMLRPKVTIRYPEQRVPTPARFRGAPAWVFKEDSSARCVGCGTCVLACPHGVIDMKTSPSEEGFRQVDYYAIHITRCLFCGLCVESCPFEALEMSSAFELSRYERTDLVYTLEDWRGGRRPDRRERERAAVAV
jgi:NADH-quinone oxidoreductase subunit I